jgi:ribosome-associated protein
MDLSEQQKGASNDKRSLAWGPPERRLSVFVTPLACQPLGLRAMALHSTLHHARPAKSSMQTQEFKLSGEYIALCDLLKLTGIADSGGQGKLMIANGEATVDGQPESRKTAKIRANQTVRCLGQEIRVVAA